MLYNRIVTLQTRFADQFLVMTYSNSHTKPNYTKHAKGKLGTIAIASVFLFTISAVTPASATELDTSENSLSTTSSYYSDSSESIQSLVVPSTAMPVAVVRDSYTATSETELAQTIAAELAAANAAAEAARQTTLASVSSGRQISTAQVAPNQVIPANGILAAAQQWVGVVPYGSGNHPSDTFSCDGYVQYVFAQNGISLPRGADAQAKSGTPISQADAKAGDLLWWPGQHIAIYDGNGGMYDAPMPGRMVQHRSTLWGNPVFIRL
jgi:cell wall-associated NlpC family hydrolase